MLNFFLKTYTFREIILIIKQFKFINNKLFDIIAFELKNKI